MAKVFRVLKWALFETAKSRTYKQKSQGSFPIKMSGAGYLRMMREPDGPAMYGTFIGICMIAHAATSLERQGYLTDTGGIAGEPYDSDDISLKISIAESLVLQTIDFCTSEKVGWMSVEESLYNAKTCKAKDTVGIPDGYRRDTLPDYSRTIQYKTRQSKDKTIQDNTTPPNPQNGGMNGVGEKGEPSFPTRLPEFFNGLVGNRLVTKHPAFVAFWEAYPKKTQELRAAIAWNEALQSGYTPAEIMAGIGTCPGIVNASCAQKVLNPVEYLTGARWTDRPVALAPAGMKEGTSNAESKAIAKQLGFIK